MTIYFCPGFRLLFKFLQFQMITYKLEQFGRSLTMAHLKAIPYGHSASEQLAAADRPSCLQRHACCFTSSHLPVVRIKLMG